MLGEPTGWGIFVLEAGEIQAAGILTGLDRQSLSLSAVH
jgi:hypothetical protein